MRYTLHRRISAELSGADYDRAVAYAREHFLRVVWRDGYQIEGEVEVTRHSRADDGVFDLDQDHGDLLRIDAAVKPL